jgi:pimeloyl-ACP methyl ester carboxylesterase
VPAATASAPASNYDRRGRGASTDTAPYGVEREIEDLRALIDAAGGRAHLYGASSGGALALEAAAAGLPVDHIAVYEVPYSVGAEAVRRWRSYVEDLRALLAGDRRGDAFALFMRMAGASDEMVASAQASPYWAGCEALAPTLAYDAIAAALPDARREVVAGQTHMVDPKALASLLARFYPR